MNPSLCVVIHDVAPATLPACRRLMRAVADIAPVPFTLLAVPRYHCQPCNVEFREWLARRYVQGDEIALHGYTHQDDGTPSGVADRLVRRHYTRGEGEFSDLGILEALRRLSAGMRWVSEQGFVLHGFVAPAWLLSQGTWDALRWMGLSYTCTLRRLVLLPERRAQLTSQSIVYSTANVWRRQASLAWNATVAAAQARSPLLRIELHPRDADYPAVCRSWQHVLADGLETRKPITLRDAARALREDIDRHAQPTDAGPPSMRRITPAPSGSTRSPA